MSTEAAQAAPIRHTTTPPGQQGNERHSGHRGAVAQSGANRDEQREHDTADDEQQHLRAEHGKAVLLELPSSIPATRLA